MVSNASDRVMKVSRFASLAIVIFLLAPFILLIFKFQNLSFIDAEDFYWATRNSIIQAAASASFALILGLVWLLALIWIQSNWSAIFFQTFKILSLLPGMFPSLFTILILMNIIRPFPIGLSGIILVHAYIYSGFIAVTFFHSIQEKSLGLIEMSYVLGAKRRQVIKKLFYLFRWEIFSIWLLVFSICFSSLAVPIAVGGGRGTTLEVLIFEKIHNSGAWNQALTLSLIQSVFLFVLSILQRPGLTRQVGRAVNIPLLGQIGSAVLMIVVYFLFFGSFLFFSIQGWLRFNQMKDLLAANWQSLPLTLLVGLLAGAFVYLLLLLSAYGGALTWRRKFLNGYIAPSTSLAGLIIILHLPDSINMQVLYYICAFVTLIFCGLYRMGFDQQVTSLKSQLEVAYTLGSSDWLSFKKIIFPQVHSYAAQLAGIAGLWIVGDFALSKIVFSQDVLLSQVVQGLMNSYHLDSAMAMMCLVILLGMIIYFLFERLSCVGNFKFK